MKSDGCLGINGLGHVYVNNKCQVCGKIFYPKEAEVKRKVKHE